MSRPRYARALSEIRRRAKSPARRRRNAPPMFHDMARLHYSTVAAGDSPYETLRSLADTRSRSQVNAAISNASYASRVYAALVVPGHLAEDEFDRLTFADCLSAVRAAKLPPVAVR